MKLDTWHVLYYNDDNLYKYLKKEGILIATLAIPRDNSQRQDKNTYKINRAINNQKGCIVMIPSDEKEFESCFSQFKTIDIGHEKHILYINENFHSHYYEVFQK